MSKFDELKKAAEAAIEREDCDRFIQRDDAQAVLDLLAIQAQLVEALRNLIIAADNLDPQCGIPIGYAQLIDATIFADNTLSASGIKP